MIKTLPYSEAFEQALPHFHHDAFRTHIFLSRYALRTMDGAYREWIPEHMWNRIARVVARNEKDKQTWKRRFYALLEDFRFVPAGRILFSAGNPRRSTFFNCYFIPIQSDSVHGITRWMYEASKTFSQGGGVGTNIDVLRPKGARVGNAGIESSGAVSFMEVFSALTGVMGGSSGRRGALMMTCHIAHPDILEFIQSKADPERRSIRHANISVRIPDSFFHILETDGPIQLFFQTPYERIEKHIPARTIWEALIENAWLSAEPGVLFWDTIIRGSTTQYGGMEVEGVNVCGEVPMEPYGACNLGSINLTQFVSRPFSQKARFQWDAFEDAIHVAVRFLDNIIDIGKNRHPLRKQKQASLKTRRIGLGIMGLADACTMLGFPYESPQTLDFCRKLFRTFRDEAYRASIELAREKGPFPGLDHKLHYDQPFFHEFSHDVKRALIKYGHRNAALLSLAPTGTISILAGCSNGIEPVYAYRFRRYADDRVFESVHPLISLYHLEERLRENDPLFQEALDISPFFRVELQALIQGYIDQSISTTLHLPSTVSKKIVEELILRAWKKGCKGLTLYREGSRKGVVEREEGEPPLIFRNPQEPCKVCEIENG